MGCAKGYQPPHGPEPKDAAGRSQWQRRAILWSTRVAIGYTSSVPNTERNSGIRTRRARRQPGHRTANRLMDILELLAASRDGLALREVSACLRAPKSSLLPLLRALTSRGYLAQGRAVE